MLSRRIVLVAVATLCVAPPSHALRLMSYNLLNYGSGGRTTEFRAVLAATQPDVLVVEEIAGSPAAVSLFLSDVLNVVNPGEWVAGTFTDGPDTDNAIYYRPAKCSLVSHYTISTTLREIDEWTLRPVSHASAAARFRLYAVHLKASQGTTEEQQRLAEVTQMRARMETYAVGQSYAVLGDFNIYTATEPAYQYMTSPADGLAGVVVDPLGREGNWHDNPAFADIHTQSPRTQSFGGGATGGMDDRFDMILVSPAVLDGEGFDLLVPTYTAFGQDGAHFNGAIIDPPYTVVDSVMARRLHDASDHLPLFADYQLPALLDVAGALDLGPAIVGGAPIALLEVGNDAAVPADELDFSFAPPAGFFAPAGVFQAAPGAASPYAIGMDTSVPGAKAGTLVVASDDPDRTAANVALSGTVLGHAVPSASGASHELFVALDLGSVADPDTAAALAEVHDLGYGPLQASLDVHAADLTGDPGFFLDGGFVPQQAAGSPAAYGVRFDAAGAALGVHTATLVFHTRDGGALPGGTDLADVRFDLSVTVVDGATAADVLAALPARTGFTSLAPNPFRASSEIRFGLARPGRARVAIVDLAGRSVSELADRQLPAGFHALSWDGRDRRGSVTAPGVYFVRLVADGTAETRKLIRVR